MRLPCTSLIQQHTRTDCENSDWKFWLKICLFLLHRNDFITISCICKCMVIHNPANFGGYSPNGGDAQCGSLKDSYNFQHSYRKNENTSLAIYFCPCKVCIFEKDIKFSFQSWYPSKMRVKSFQKNYWTLLWQLKFRKCKGTKTWSFSYKIISPESLHSAL